MPKNKQNIYTIVRIHYATYEELEHTKEREPAVIESHEVFEDAENACTAYEQEYYDKEINGFKFCVKINTYYGT